MADLKISQLDAVGSAAGADTYPVVSGGITKKETVTQLFTLLYTQSPTLTGASWSWQGGRLWQYWGSTDADAASVAWMKARNTIASPNIVASGDNMGYMTWYGYDGDEYIPSARIMAKVDGTPGNGDMPGRIEFWTTPDGGDTMVERMRIDNAGIVSMANQSRARAYRGASYQTIPTGVWAVAYLDTESWDTQGEYDTTKVDGTVHSDTSGTTLVATASIFALADVGRSLYNTTDGTYTTITGYTNGTTVTVGSAIFATGETFMMYWSRFKATVAGYYLVKGATYWGDRETGKGYTTAIYVNGAIVNNYNTLISENAAEGNGGEQIDIYYLSAGHYVQLVVYHDSAAAQAISSGANTTYLSVHKLS